MNLKIILVLLLVIICVSSEDKVSYRNAKYVEFEVTNEKQFNAVKTLEYNNDVRNLFIPSQVGKIY